MAEGLTRKKRIQGGHRAPTVRTITQLYEVIESTDEVETVVTKLKQCKLTLQDKLVFRQLDDEILGLVDDEEVENEIEQADTFRERIHRAIIDSIRALETKTVTRTAVITSPPMREVPDPSTSIASTTTVASTTVIDTTSATATSTTTVSGDSTSVPVSLPTVVSLYFRD